MRHRLDRLAVACRATLLTPPHQNGSKHPRLAPSRAANLYRTMVCSVLLTSARLTLQGRLLASTRGNRFKLREVRRFQPRWYRLTRVSSSVQSSRDCRPGGRGGRVRKSLAPHERERRTGRVQRKMAMLLELKSARGASHPPRKSPAAAVPRIGCRVTPRKRMRIRRSHAVGCGSGGVY